MSQNSEPRNRKLGVGIWYATIIIAVVVMLGALFLIKDEDAALVSYYRYLIAYFTIGGLLSLGCIIREWFVEICNTKKWIIKIVVFVIAMAIGAVVFSLTKKPIFGMMMMFLGFGVLLYETVPTIPHNNQDVK